MSPGVWALLLLAVLPFGSGVASAPFPRPIRVVFGICTGAVTFGVTGHGLALHPLSAALLAIPIATVAFLAGLGLAPHLPPPIRSGVFVLWLSLPVAAFVPPELAERTETVTTTVVVAMPAEDAWRRVVSFSSHAGSGLFPGLPVPQRCTVEGDVRVCHFDRGSIAQRITASEPPRRLAVDVVKVDLPFMPFALTSAEYSLTPRGAQTEIVRSTTLRSRQAPAWFFAPLERMAVAAEHRHLLGAL